MKGFILTSLGVSLISFSAMAGENTSCEFQVHAKNNSSAPVFSEKMIRGNDGKFYGEFENRIAIVGFYNPIYNPAQVNYSYSLYVDSSTKSSGNDVPESGSIQASSEEYNKKGYKVSFNCQVASDAVSATSTTSESDSQRIAEITSKIKLGIAQIKTKHVEQKFEGTYAGDNRGKLCLAQITGGSVMVFFEKVGSGIHISSTDIQDSLDEGTKTITLDRENLEGGIVRTTLAFTENDELQSISSKFKKLIFTPYIGKTCNNLVKVSESEYKELSKQF